MTTGTPGAIALPENSQLEQLIRAHLEAAPPFRRTAGTRTVFLPWYSPGEYESEGQVKDLARRLEMKIVVLPSHYSLTHDPRLLGDLIEAVCRDPGEAEVKLLQRALRELPYSPALERAILDRLSEQSPGNRIAIAALRAGHDADSSVGRVLDWIRALQLDAVLVFAHRRPGGSVETVNLPLHRMVQDVIQLVPKMISETVSEQSGTQLQHRARNDSNGNNGSNGAVDHAPAQASFFSRLRAHLESVMTREKRKAEMGAELDDAGVDADVVGQSEEKSNGPPDRLTEDVARWAELLARLSGANWAAADEVSQQWRKVGEAVNKRIASQRRDHALYLDNEEERETFEGRLRFLVMLRVLYPQAFAAAAHELDGADQLYRIHLTLCGAAAKDHLLSHSLLPFWKSHLEDPLFCELFYACFLTVERNRPLTERFESRAQLHRLLLWLDACEHVDTNAVGVMKELVSSHLDWLRMLSSVDKKSAQGAPRSDAEIWRAITAANAAAANGMRSSAKRVLAGEPSATEALQAAQILMSICELLSEQDGIASDSLYTLIDALTLKAINQSAGAVRFDASLLRARSLALRGQAVAALEILRIMRRTSRDALGRCAAQIEEAYVHEREQSYVRAIALYEEAMGIAEDLGADELVARAVSGCLRCEAIAESHKPGIDPQENERRRQVLLHLRARIILQIQCARAPELFPLSSRDMPTLFISYRAESRSVTHALVKVLNEEKSELRAWADVELASHQDFNPTIHRRLHDADAIVILLSPEYFESSWCVAELHFALSQNEVRGVPLCWLWCESNDNGESAEARADRLAIPCEILAWRAIRRSLHTLALKRRRHEWAHVKERLRRIFARGRLLHEKAVIFEKNEVDKAGAPIRTNEKEFPMEKANELCEPLREMASYLYARAKLRKRKTRDSIAQ